MTHSPELMHLAARWSDAPEGTAFAALADGLRKCGKLSEAEAVAMVGLTRHPELIPGLIALARVRADQGDPEGAEATLQRALGVDPSHPVVLEELAALSAAGGDLVAARAWSTVAEVATEPEAPEPVAELEAQGLLLPAMADEAGPQPSGEWDDDAGWDEEPLFPDEDSPELVTESLANLYEAQGHLGRAADAFRTLAERHPEHSEFQSRAARLDAELTRHRPRPYDAAASGGIALGDWLGAVAAAVPTAPPREAGFDAFFEAPLPAARDTADFAAFQDWLRGLGR